MSTASQWLRSRRQYRKRRQLFRRMVCAAVCGSLLFADVSIAYADSFSDGQNILLGSQGTTNFVGMGNGIATGTVNYGQGGQGNCDTTKGTVCANDVLPSSYGQGNLSQFTSQYGGTNNAGNVQSAGYQQQLNDKTAGAGGNGTTPTQWLDYSANQGASSRNFGTSIGSTASDNLTQISQGTDPSGSANTLAGIMPSCMSTTDASGNVHQSCTGVVQCLGNSCYNPQAESNSDFGSFAAAAQIINGMKSGMVCAETGKAPSQANTCTPYETQVVTGYTQDPNQPDCSTCTVPVYKTEDYCKETGKSVQITCNGGSPQDLDGVIPGDIPSGCQLYTPPPNTDSYPAQCTPTVFVGEVNACSNYVGSGVGLTNDCCAQGAKSASSLSLTSLIALSDMIPQVQQLKAQLAQQVESALSPLTNAVKDIGSNLSDFAGQIEGGLSNMVSSGSVGAGFECMADGTGAGTEINAAASLSANGSSQGITSGIQQFVQNQLTNMVGQQTAQELMQAYQYFNYAMTAYTIAATIGGLATKCSTDELQMGVKEKNKECVTMPEYCATSGGFTCLQYTTKACCYGSMISRVLAQQIKAQLNAGVANGGYGASDNPDCSGFSPQQLAQVDWSKVDLSEWLATLNETGYSLPQTASQVNAAESGPTSLTSYYEPSTAPTTNQVQNSVIRANQLTSGGVMEASRANATLTQPTCYTDPTGIPTYSKAIEPTDVIKAEGAVQSDYGFDQITSCTPTAGAHCMQINLGKQGDNYLNDSCSRIWRQLYNFNVLRPDLIVSARLMEVEWDDHIDIKINGQDVFTSPDFYTNAYFVSGGVCDLERSWNALSAPGSGQTEWNPPGLNPPGPPTFVDLTTQFQHGGMIDTETDLIVGGGGEGDAFIQIQYNDPPNQIPTNCISPPNPQ